MNASATYAVTVLFHPDLATLEDQIRALSPQVAGIFLVDNAPAVAGLDALIKRYPAIKMRIPMPGNCGLGAAQNQGIQAAITAGATKILLMDQDSLPATDMVQQLAQAIESAQKTGRKVAAAGANYTDTRLKNAPPFIQVYGGRLHRKERERVAPFTDVDYVVSSGCLIDVAALKQIGMMDEGLFIDFVDTEWGLRAQNFGFGIIGAWDAQLTHSLGNTPIVLAGKPYPNNAPYRQFSMYRNAMVLLFRRRLPLRWKFVEFYRLFLRAGFYSLFAPPRFRRFMAITHGIAAGLRGQQGPIDVAMRRYPAKSLQERHPQ